MDKIDLPVGFGMALAQNEQAMKEFEKLGDEEKNSFIDRTHNVRSKEEMQLLVDELTK